MQRVESMIADHFFATDNLIECLQWDPFESFTLVVTLMFIKIISKKGHTHFLTCSSNTF